MLELILHHTPNKIRVRLRVEGQAEQEREADFACALSDNERFLIQWYLENYLLHPYGPFRQRAAEAEAAMTAVGERLFNAVFGDRHAYALYARVADDLANCRIAVEADDAVGWTLPWELLRDPERDLWLAPKAAAFARRHPQGLLPAAPVPADLPTLNVLMVICRPQGGADVPFQSVARPLLEIFRPHRQHVNLDILRPPTFSRLGEVLHAHQGFYHVLHFDGHGKFTDDPRAARLFFGQTSNAPQGVLLFEGEDGDDERKVSGSELGDLLKLTGVPVVLLNACQSGMASPDAAFGSVGQQLLASGARGVVAMAYSVYVHTAAQFMAGLYAALLNGEPLASAVTAGRLKLWSKPDRPTAHGDVSLRDWIVPVLFESAPVQLTQPRKGLVIDTTRLTGQLSQEGAEVDLPAPPDYGFVGRDAVILELERAFRSDDIVLLHAPAGEGKTTTAVGFARWWAETGGLGGPAFFFSFTNHLPLRQVCDHVGEVFGDALRAQRIEWHLQDDRQRRELARQVLRQVPCLMIWDNFEPVAGFPFSARHSERSEESHGEMLHSVQHDAPPLRHSERSEESRVWTANEQAELRSFLHDLRGGATKVLITSRRDETWLGNVYRRVEMGGLNAWEAREFARVTLAREGKRLPDLQFGREADDPYQALLNYLRGNPLALQVILREVARGVDPTALLRDLQTGEARLPRDDAAQGRERSLAAALSYGLDALDPTLRQRLGVLALFQGFVAAGVLEAMCQQVEGAPELIRGLGEDDWTRMLNAAAEVGLLRRVGDGFYTIHPALPWFFHDLLREAFPDHQDWLERAFSAVYGASGYQLSQLFQTNTQFAMNLLRAEENNLMHALRLARRHERWDDVEGILCGLRTLLVTQARWVEWERLIGDIEAGVTDKSGEPLTGWEDLWRALLGHRQEMAEYRRDFDTQERILHRLREHYERAGDDRNHAATLHNLGRIAEERRQFEEAEGWYRRALAIAERIGDEHGQAQTLHQLGRIAQERRQFEEAEGWYRRVLAIAERIGDEHTQASTLHNLGIIAQERRQFEEAEGWYRQSLAIKERIGDEQGQASTLHQLGMIAEERGNVAEAVRFYELAEAMFARLNDPHSLGIVRASLQRVKG